MTESVCGDTEPARDAAGGTAPYHRCMPNRGHAARRHVVCRWMRKVGVVFTVSTYTLMAPFGYAIFALVCALPTRDEVARTRRLQRITARAYRFMHAWLRLARIAEFDPRHALTSLPQGPCVIIANHPSSLDVTAIMATLGDVFTVVKPRVFRRRMIRPLLMGAGHVEGPNASPGSTRRVIDESVARLQQGMSLLIFPEGTRSPPGRIHPFGRTAFEIACRANVPLVSIASRCEPIWLSKESPLFAPPHPKPRVELTLLATDHPVTVAHDSRALRQRAEARYRAWLAADSQRAADARPVAEVAEDTDANVSRSLGRSGAGS